jgi:hypothetical protein
LVAGIWLSRGEHLGDLVAAVAQPKLEQALSELLPVLARANANTLSFEDLRHRNAEGAPLEC